MSILVLLRRFTRLLCSLFVLHYWFVVNDSSMVSLISVRFRKLSVPTPKRLEVLIIVLIYFIRGDIEHHWKVCGEFHRLKSWII